MKDYILSVAAEAPPHRLPWWLDNAAEVCWPVHDAPAVWRSWGLHPGGLPVLESLHGLPFTPLQFADEGLPTLEVVSGEGKG